MKEGVGGHVQLSNLVIMSFGIESFKEARAYGGPKAWQKDEKMLHGLLNILLRAGANTRMSCAWSDARNGRILNVKFVYVVVQIDVTRAYSFLNFGNLLGLKPEAFARRMTFCCAHLSSCFFLFTTYRSDVHILLVSGRPKLQFRYNC